MDWLYVWAYHRIAERSGRRADEVSSQLRQVISEEWAYKPPGRGRGFCEQSAWGSYAAWQTAGIREPRNFFAPNKSFVGKLRRLAVTRWSDLQRDFAGVFAEDPADVEALRAIGFSPDGLKYEGIVVVAWGIPKGVVWLGCTRETDAWSRPPEERALLLQFPLVRLSDEPVCPTLSTQPTNRRWVRNPDQDSWRGEVVLALLAALGAVHQDGAIWRRNNAFVLAFPSAAEVAAVRAMQLRGERYPIRVIDDLVVMEAARWFPWLWDNSSADYCEAYDRLSPPLFDEAVRFILIYAVFAALTHRATALDLTRLCWADVTGDSAEVEQKLRSDGVLGLGKGRIFKRDYEIRMCPNTDIFFDHRGTRAILARVSEWLIDRGNSSLLESLSQIWRPDPAYRDQLDALRSTRS